MATSLIVPLAYITILVTSLAIFSRIYRRRKAAEKTSWEAWFPTHPSRDIYISLLSSPSDHPVPDSLLKSALLVRATADVKRIWRIRDDKIALTNLHNKGLVGDDTMARFAAAEKELEAEIVDVVSEANTFRQGWGGMIFQTATEMAHAERTRETVLNISRVKEREERKMIKQRKLLGEPMPQQITIKPSMTPPGAPNQTSTTTSAAVVPPAPAGPTASGGGAKTDSATAAPAASSASDAAPTSQNGTPKQAAVEEFATPSTTKSGSSSGTSTPSKASGKKKKGKK